MVGTPAAYLLATREFRGRPLVVTLVELPLVLPPAAAGIALLAALGPNGILGPLLDDAGIQLVLETAGVIVALMFVSAPFFLRQAQSAFEAVPPNAGGLADAWRRRGRHPRGGSHPRGASGLPPALRSPGAGRWASSARR